MSHLRSDLNNDDRLYQSVGAPLLTPTAPAKRTWRDAVDRALAVLREWRHRRRARREMATVDAHTLRDIGIAPELVDYEASQPFWRPLRNLRD